MSIWLVSLRVRWVRLSISWRRIGLMLEVGLDVVQHNVSSGV